MPNTLASSFRNAFSGISYALRTQRNARIHLGVTLAVFLLIRPDPAHFQVKDAGTAYRDPRLTAILSLGGWLRIL